MTETPLERSDAPSGATLDWSDPSTLPVGDVRELVVALGKALRAQQLYDVNNPVYQRFLSQLSGGFRGLWRHMDSLQIGVEEDALTWMGEEVYRSASRSDSLAFLLYKDGVREVVFREGLEGGELPQLLTVLNRARDLRPEGEDLLTLLWEADFQHLTYAYVDLLAEGVELPMAGEGFPGGFQKILEEEMGAGEEGEEAEEGTSGGEASQAQVSAEDFNPTLYSLDPLELDAIQQELARESTKDFRVEVLAGLFDRVEEPRYPERQREILEIFHMLLPSLLSRGALAPAGAILEELVRLVKAEGALASLDRDRAEAILDEISGAESLGELVQALEDGTISPEPAELGVLLRHLRAGALAPLLRAAEETGNKGIQAIIREAVGGIARRHREAIVKCLASPDPIVVAGACALAGTMALTEAGPAVANLLAHPEARVRLAAVEAAAGIKASTAVGGLPQALGDKDREVRIAAARALGALRYLPAAPHLRSILGSRALRQADVSEQIAFFESYGLLRDDEAIPFLDGLLNGRGFLGRREPGEIRACAALGLGKVGTPDAHKALSKAQDDADPVVRSAVSRALRGEG